MATTAAILIVVGSALEATGGTLNWLQATGDQFAEKSLGYRINSLSGPPAIVGAVAISVGVIRRTMSNTTATAAHVAGTAESINNGWRPCQPRKG